MKNKILILFIITILSSDFSIAQITTNYEHCNCKEIINYSDNNNTIKNGEYLLKCNNSLVEKGLYKNGNKDGIWIVKNQNGKTVSRIEFTDGKLNGSYELFNFDGNPKLKAEFNDNKPEGEWIYSNKKGKILKKGKKVIASYDFDKNKSLISNQSKIKNSYLPREDESGEYIIIYYPSRKHLANNIPFEGNIRSNKEFIDLLNVPFILMNTVTNYDFKIKANIKDGNLEYKIH